MNYLSGHAVNVAEIAQMADRRTVGYSLEAPFYTSQAVHDLDLEAIFGQHWLFCATEAEVPEPGDYLTMEIGGYSIIVVRDDDETLKAMHNVCRHRGSRILESACGSVGNLVCPYHQWTYRTDGSLIYAEGQPPEFDRSRFGLKPVHVRAVGGLIFVCLAEDPPDEFDEMADHLGPYLASYRLKEAKVAHQMDLVEEGNWKLVMENNRECQHCDASHPELITAYFPFHRYNDDDVTPRMRPAYERFQAATTALEQACAVSQVPCDTVRELDSRRTAFMIMRLPLDGDGASFGPDGAQVSRKLLGDVTDPRFGDLTVHTQPNSWLHFLSDHAVVFRVLPVAPGRSVVRTTWLVHPDAVEGVDYEIDTLTAVWRATNREDGELVERAQRGVADPSHEPGPYSLVEDDVEAFVGWYVQRVQDYLAPHHEHVEQLGRLSRAASR